VRATTRPKAVLLGLALTSVRCPQHPSVQGIMGCAKCAREFYEHAERVAALGPIRRPAE